MADDNKVFNTAPVNWADVLADTLPVLKSTYVPLLGESYQFYNIPGFTGLVVWKHGNLAGDTLVALPVQGLMTDQAQTIPGVKTFGSIPVLPATVPTSDNQAISKTHAEALLGLPAGYLYGMETEAGTDADHDVIINIGKCRDYADTVDIELTSTLEKRIDATWAVGDGNGGLFSGSVAVDSTYHYFVIVKDSDSSVDGGWDTDIDAANIPSGYTSYRRSRSYLTDSSANLLNTTQHGDIFTHKDPISDLNAVMTSTPTSVALSLPSGLDLLAKISVQSDPSISRGAYVYSPSDNDPASISNGYNISISTTRSEASTQHVNVLTDSATQVRVLTSSNLTTVIYTMGWTDTRGRFGGK